MIVEKKALGFRDSQLLEKLSEDSFFAGGVRNTFLFVFCRQAAVVLIVAGISEKLIFSAEMHPRFKRQKTACNLSGLIIRGELHRTHNSVMRDKLHAIRGG